MPDLALKGGVIYVGCTLIVVCIRYESYYLAGEQGVGEMV